MSKIIIFTSTFWMISKLLNFISYNYIKNKILHSKRWDLNICCGKTDGGGINADIVKHADVNNFSFIKDIYNLPFDDLQFEHVLCSHTIEHLDDPHRFLKELKRIGKHVTIVVPPLWDIAAVINIFEHRSVFLTLNKKHVNRLPFFIELPFAKRTQSKFGQYIHC